MQSNKKTSSKAKIDKGNKAYHEIGLLLVVLHKASLAADLGSDVVVRQPCGGEERDLLAARD